jgi:hypothetical protein
MERNSNANDERRPEPEQLAEGTSAGPAPQSRSESSADAYERRMSEGARQYGPILDLLKDMGLPAFFAQTGGMNAAIEVTLNARRYLWVTDIAGALPWQWADHQDWAVGLYQLPDTDDGDTADPLRYRTTEDGSLEALASLIHEVLGQQEQGRE